jgi:hypothetical protein
VTAPLQLLFSEEWYTAYENGEQQHTVLDVLEVMARAFNEVFDGVKLKQMRWRFVKSCLHLLVGQYVSKFIDECLTNHRKTHFKLKHNPCAASFIQREIKEMRAFASDYGEEASETTYATFIEKELDIFNVMFEFITNIDDEMQPVYIPKVAGVYMCV